MKKYFTNIHKNKTYNLIVRVLIIFTTYYFIYAQIFKKKKLEEVVILFHEIIDQPHIYFFLTWTLLLMIVNWGIESLKWQFLINKIEKISFSKAFEAVLAGVSVALFTPNRVGEWFGRVFILDKANPWKGIVITMVGSFAQLLTTIVVGSLSLLIYIPIYYKNSDLFSNYLYFGLILIVVVIVSTLIFIFLNIKALPGFLTKFFEKRFPHFYEYISVISEYSTFELASVLILSFLRYCVFTLQFYIILMLFSVNLPLLQGMIIISLVFFIMTAIPTVTLAELGIRGSVSIFFIGSYFEKFAVLTDKITLGIVASSSALWLINLALPAIIGTFFVYRLKFFRRNKDND